MAIALLWLAAPAAPMALAAALPALESTGRDPFVGVYDGGQTELATMLELRADGRFRYVLSYGALDEQAEGSWSVEANAVLLTSDPIAAPSFMILSARETGGEALHILLDLPTGMSRQYFDAEIRRADGSQANVQLGEEGLLLPFSATSPRPVAVALSLPMFDLRSQSVPLPTTGGVEIRFSFAPNDLGKVAFARTMLPVEGGELLMTRHERKLRFRRKDREVRAPRQ